MSIDTEGINAVANTDAENRHADIVFIHGLGGGSHSTWSFGKKGDPGYYFWPEQLAKELPNCGVWTVGYAAGITHLGNPGMIIEKRAPNVAAQLSTLGIGNRPLMFVAHSMGGLVVKSLLVSSKLTNDSSHRLLARSVRGIVFCGTPHRGSDYVTAAAALGAFIGGRQGHVKQMAANAEPLDLLHDAFLTACQENSIEVQSYAESIGLFRKRLLLRPLPLGCVVPRASANPGIGTIRDVDADHLALVKPSPAVPAIYGVVYRGVFQFIIATLNLSPNSCSTSEADPNPESLGTDAIQSQLPQLEAILQDGTTATPAKTIRRSGTARTCCWLVAVASVMAVLFYFLSPIYFDWQARCALTNEYLAVATKDENQQRVNYIIDCQACGASEDELGHIGNVFSDLLDTHDVQLTNCASLTSLDGFEHDLRLNALRISSAPSLYGRIDIGKYTSLRFLELGGCGTVNVSCGTGGCPSIIEEVRISSCSGLNALDLSQLQHLKMLSLRDCPELKDLKLPQIQSALRVLVIRDCEQVAKLEFLENQSTLNYLSLVDVSVTTVGGTFEKLRCVEFHQLPDSVSFETFNARREAGLNAFIPDPVLEKQFRMQVPHAIVFNAWFTGKYSDFVSDE